MSWKDIFIDALQSDFEHRRREDPRFSLRKHARELGLAPASLSELQNGKLELSIERAVEVVRAFDISSREKTRLVDRIGDSMVKDLKRLVARG